MQIWLAHVALNWSAISSIESTEVHFHQEWQKKKLQQLSRDQIPWHLRNWRRRWEADVCRDDFLLWNSPGTSSELKPSDVNLLESSMLNTLNYTTYCNPVPFVLNLACTEFSKRNGAKFGKLSMNFPKMADWLWMGWPSCPAALGR